MIILILYMTLSGDVTVTPMPSKQECINTRSFMQKKYPRTAGYARCFNTLTGKEVADAESD